MAEKQEPAAEGSKSKTILLTGTGGYENLKIVEEPRPHAGRGQVVLNVKASGINFAELMCRMGLYPNRPKLPAVLGLEASGVITEVGHEVKDLKVGDRVLCMNNFGLWTEYASVAAENCFPIPDEMTYQEAAAIPVNYVTAYHMLFEFGNLRKGKSVLIHMAAGGVGIAATQLCHTVPDVTVFGTASKGKHDIIKEYGCTHPIDYRTQDYVEEVKKISPKGVDIVLDPLSGDDSTKGFKLLKPLGKIIHFGSANMVTGHTRSIWQAAKTLFKVNRYHPITQLMPQNKGACGYHLGMMTKEIDLIQEAALAIIDLYKEGKVKPRVDSVWTYDQIGEAMERMHSRQNIGKVIITPHETKIGDKQT